MEVVGNAEIHASNGWGRLAIAKGERLSVELEIESAGTRMRTGADSAEGVVVYKGL